MLKTLELENFRNHKKFKLDFDYCTVLIGPNGVGKTNVLESIVMLSFCRSFRSEDKKNLIKNDAEFARIKSENLEIFLARFPRLIMKAKSADVPRKIADFIGFLPAVVFSAETISTITGPPALRRRFLDIMLSQVDREYLLSLVNYKKIRQQRNSLLQQIAEGKAFESQLDFWDEELAKETKIISEKREEAVLFLNQVLTKIYLKISGKPKDILKLDYEKNYSGNLIDNLKEFRRREIAYRGTIFGPHRDELKFSLNNLNMADYASRGELKSAVLALKIGELNFLEKSEKLKQKLGENEVKPLLLLDDIFAEFDEERQKHLSDLILNYQSVLTTASKKNLPKKILEIAKIIELKQKD